MAALPLLTGTRVRLDPLTENDYSCYRALHTCPEVAAPAGVPPLNDEQSVKAFFNTALFPASQGRILALRHNDAEALIGVICLTEWDSHAGVLNLGYCLATEFWGQGLMHEGLSLLLPWLLAGGMGEPLHRLQAWGLLGNERSCRLLTRLGFRLEGILRHLYYDSQTHQDVCAYGLLRSDLCLNQRQAGFLVPINA